MTGDAFLKYLASVYVFVTNPSLTEGALHISRQKIISNRSLLFHASRIGMPAYIQSKVFTYKSWQPPNFRVHIPLKASKEKEKEPEELELGEIREETVHNPTISQVALIQPDFPADVDQLMEDVDDALHPSEDSIQEHLLSSVSEPLGMREAVFELKVNEGIREMTHESKHTPRPEAEDRQNTVLEGVDGNRKPTADHKDDTGTEGNIDEVNKSADAVKANPAKKKVKPRRKKVSSEDQTTQLLGDKVTLLITELCDGH